MKVSKAYRKSDSKWLIVIEGIENNRKIKNYIAIPPTTGDRLDIITNFDIKGGYNYDIDGAIIVNILNGFPHISFFDKGLP